MVALQLIVKVKVVDLLCFGLGTLTWRFFLILNTTSMLGFFYLTTNGKRRIIVVYGNLEVGVGRKFCNC